MWVTLDISLCTASIWHMCTMSMDRFFTLKYPMKYGRNKTHTMVALKITFVWVVSLGISSPIFAKGFLNYKNVFNDGICAPTSQEFLLYGSILAFYVPLCIMVVTYVLTIRILYNNQRLMKKISRQQTELSRLQFSKNGGVPQMYGQYTFLSPNLSFSRGSRKPSEDISILLSTSRRASFQESVSTHQESLGKEPAVVEESGVTGQEESSPLLQITDASTENSHRSSIPSTLSASQPNLNTSTASLRAVRRSHSYQPNQHRNQYLQVTGKITHTNSTHISLKCKHWAVRSQPDLQTGHNRHCSVHKNRHVKLASSQPHLPSMHRCSSYRPTPTYPSHSFKKINSILDLESVQNFDTLSACSSAHSVWSDFQEPIMLEKLSQIEAEMDLCLSENPSRPKVRTAVDDQLTETIGEDTQSQVMLSNSTVQLPSLHSNTSLKSHSEHITTNSVTMHTDPGTCQLNGGPATLSESRPSLVTVELSVKKTFDKPEVCTKFNQSTYVSSKKSQCDPLSQNASTSDSPHTSPTRLNHCKSEPLLWRTLSNTTTNPRITVNKHIKSNRIMSKRTASNEKKASKVLGIIFIVFVVLWTPFFLVNIMLSLCSDCHSLVSPALMTAFTWLGWLSSLGNPIIYTMFNTAFRDTFYRILTCKYTFCRKTNKQRACAYSRASHSMATVNRTGLVNQPLDTNHLHTN